ncbi:MAG: 4Fe-4S dicluster domain-containing protein [Defluviitaleaceae bacterium]|nr:4Fe-4S dicluster domain-containing protein [Defluviitaleaceae bacterium]
MLNPAFETKEILLNSRTIAEKCMKCGRCSAACPSYEQMDIRPHQFVSYLMRGDVDGLLSSTTLWKCLSCFACVQRCPRGVAPAQLIESVRLAAIRQKGGDGITVEDVVGELDDEMPQQLLVAAFRKYKG